MGDGNPRYRDLPRSESITFFERSSTAHPAVTSVNKLEEQRYEIKRESKSDVMVYLTNLYIVGIADVHEIIIKFPRVNCIVTISNWNSYSMEAKAFCQSQKIGLFKYKEYYGALYHDNDGFNNYEPPKKD
jgi:hypothetical protein